MQTRSIFDVTEERGLFPDEVESSESKLLLALPPWKRNLYLCIFINDSVLV